MSAVPKISQQVAISESQIASVLSNRFGDGMVYIPKNQPNSLYSVARDQGFIDAEGYLTRKGRTLIARYKYL